MTKLKLGMVAAALLLPAAVNAQIVRVSEGDFLASAGLITFSEYSVNTVNPSYTPADYGGGVGAPDVTFDGYFKGQMLSATPGVDCPGAAASACVVGNPTGPLTLDPDSPDTFITTDSANPTSPVLSGSPRFNGPIAVLFSTDQFGVGFGAGFFDAAQSTGITAFARDGTLLGTVTNNGTGIEFLGLVATGSKGIAGVFLDLVGSEPAGFAIDNVRFGVRGQVVVPGVPEPATWGMMIVGFGLVGLAARRRGFAKITA
ncbi:PEPxxWA-CTERM sorting domain-containing protein [Sandaracinobacteroides hominis]|uniref:PEPxxWA-CTERM sorting domain-containing protein n=1 Tax=Sandaracinobacteroides hominis TaxID=2780086 RepID=UPI001F1C5068|nr:PEPxxWA-CTERM sorting domain-containing protein [Sandaracinobacteroides hominis]